MTKAELKEISSEREQISKRLAVLDPNNAIESQERRMLFLRLDHLEHLIDCALIEIKHKKKCRLQII